MKRTVFLLVIIFSITYPQDGIAIAKMVDERKAPQDIVSKTTMLLTNSKGKTRTSTILSKSINNGSKQILWFLNPADDKGVAFLKIEHDDKADEMRMWLPNMMTKQMKCVCGFQRLKKFDGYLHQKRGIHLWDRTSVMKI